MLQVSINKTDSRIISIKYLLLFLWNSGPCKIPRNNLGEVRLQIQFSINNFGRIYSVSLHIDWYHTINQHVSNKSKSFVLLLVCKRTQINNLIHSLSYWYLQWQRLRLPHSQTSSPWWQNFSAFCLSLFSAVCLPMRKWNSRLRVICFLS